MFSKDGNGWHWILGVRDWVVLPHCSFGICGLDQGRILHSSSIKRYCIYCQHQGTLRCHRSVQSCLALPEPFLTVTHSINPWPFVWVRLGAEHLTASWQVTHCFLIETLWSLVSFRWLQLPPYTCRTLLAFNSVEYIKERFSRSTSINQLGSHGFVASKASKASKGW